MDPFAPKFCSLIQNSISGNFRLMKYQLNFVMCEESLILICLLHFQKGVFPDLLATSGDYLRVWRAGESDTRLECLLNNVSSLGSFAVSERESDFFL